MNHSFSKKSQIAGQIFIYIIAIILFSFILIYGYNAIKGFKERSEQITYIKFKTDLTSTVKRVAPDFGTVKREEFFIGGDYRKVCFVQSHDVNDAIRNQIVAALEDGNYPLIADIVRDKVNKNVFLFTTTLQESFDIGEINVTGRYNCTQILNGKAKIQFEGKGDHAYISTWG